MGVRSRQNAITVVWLPTVSAFGRERSRYYIPGTFSCQLKCLQRFASVLTPIAQ
jgi:hypothetical protein